MTFKERLFVLVTRKSLKLFLRLIDCTTPLLITSFYCYYFTVTHLLDGSRVVLEVVQPQDGQFLDVLLGRGRS